MNDTKGYKKLKVWEKANEFALQMYLATKNFPREEIYGITSQIRRAAISVPVNLVEGSGRQGRNETKQFANIALGSLAEVEYLLEFSLNLNYLDKPTYERLETLRQNVGGLLWLYYKSFN